MIIYATYVIYVILSPMSVGITIAYNYSLELHPQVPTYCNSQCLTHGVCQVQKCPQSSIQALHNQPKSLSKDLSNLRTQAARIFEVLTPMSYLDVYFS